MNIHEFIALRTRPAEAPTPPPPSLQAQVDAIGRAVSGLIQQQAPATSPAPPPVVTAPPPAPAPQPEPEYTPRNFGEAVLADALSRRQAAPNTSPAADMSRTFGLPSRRH